MGRSLDDVVVTSEYAARMGGTRSGWQQVRNECSDLLKSVAIASASAAVALNVSGTGGNVDRMNKRAAGRNTNTHFVNRRIAKATAGLNMAPHGIWR